MNEHFATYPTPDGGLSAIWLTGHPSPADELAYREFGKTLPKSRKLELSFRRVALGISFEPLFIVAVGERAFTYKNRTSTLFIPLDEAIDTEHTTDAWKAAILLKDRYRATRAFCPSEPERTLDSLRRLEGLTHYPMPHIEAAATHRWPLFNDFDSVCGVVPKEVPSESSLTSRLNDLLSESVIDPKTERELIGADGHPIPRILFLDDFPVHRTMQCVRTNSLAGVTALWMAVDGLSRTGFNLRLDTDREQERAQFEGRINRNPAGY